MTFSSDSFNHVSNTNITLLCILIERERVVHEVDKNTNNSSYFIKIIILIKYEDMPLGHIIQVSST